MGQKNAMTKSIIAVGTAVMIGSGASSVAADGGKSKAASTQAQARAVCAEACAKLTAEILRQRHREAHSNRQGTVSETDKPVFDISTLNDAGILNDVFIACIVKCREALR